MPEEPKESRIMSEADFPSTRAEATARLDDFLPSVPEYSDTRNELQADYGNVSRLSPALRTRVLLERDVVSTVLERYGLPEAEKFVQEVYWRLYWKSWLERRPSIWNHYVDSLGNFTDEEKDKARRLEHGESGVAIMDHFADELVETGYLQNHARMWFAGFWIHTEKIPWQLGAEFFYRHLRDADAASNTLSWRWVAGLHTEGKFYLARRSNLERYIDSDLLGSYEKGLERLEDTEPWEPGPNELENPEPEELDDEAFDLSHLSGRYGLWLHEDDLSVENSELAGCRPQAIIATERSDPTAGECKKAHFAKSLADGLDRASVHFGVPGQLRSTKNIAEELSRWATENDLQAIVALRPFIGPVADALKQIRLRLSEAGCELHLVRRAGDAELLPLAKSGFFGFWKKARRLGFELKD